MSFSSGQKYSTAYISINTACATDIHLVIQVQQVGVESDEKPLIPYDIIISR